MPKLITASLCSGNPLSIANSNDAPLIYYLSYSSWVANVSVLICSRKRQG
jgi:hypothetical protein